MRRIAESTVLLPAGALLMTLVNAASASTTFRYATDQAEYLVAPGGSAVVTIKLVEQRDSEADASVLVTQGGVIGYDLRVGRDVGAALIIDFAANPGLFDIPFASARSPDPLPFGGSPSIDFVASALDDPGPIGASIGPLIRELVLGTITVTAAGSSESSLFSVADSTYYGSNTVTNAATALDGQIQATQFTLQVPEPAIAGMLIGGAALLGRRRREKPHAPQSLFER